MVYVYYKMTRYITFLMLFLVIVEGEKIVFSLGKIFLSDEEIIHDGPK